MKIVVLDGNGLNPGDLSWEELEKLGELTVYKRTFPEDILKRSEGAEILLTNKTVLDADTLKQLPDLKYVGVLATGYNVVDVKAAKELGIVVTNIPAYSTSSVAQMVFAHILAITNRVEYYTNENRNGRWSASPDFIYYDTKLIELSGKTMGIVGLGNIGSAVAKIANAFGMKVIAKTSKSADELPSWIKSVSYDELFENSDILTLHCPFNDSTYHIINEKSLAKMKPSAIFINTSRGMLVDEYALADALNNGKIYAAGIDVLSSEPPSKDNPLLSAKNCFITPHLGWATKEARERCMDICIENVKSYIEGNPVNDVTSLN